MITASDIIGGKKELDEFVRGIYFLMDDKEIVYVGQSGVNVMSRVVSHWFDKTFDSYYVLLVVDGNLDEIEADYIWKFKPKYNGQFPPSNRYLGREPLKKRLRMTWNQIKKIIRENGLSSWHGKYDLQEFENLGISK